VTLLAAYSLDGPLTVGEPVVHADDEGFLRGRAVFETLRVYDGTAFEFDKHLHRLAESAHALGLPAPEAGSFSRSAQSAIQAAGEKDAVLRLLWTPGREGSGRPTGIALVSSLPPGLEQARARGLRLAVADWSPGRRLAAAKSTSYAENLAATHEAQARGADDALLVGPGRTALEAPTANVWFREGDCLLTPSLDQPILAGVTRGVLLDLAGEAGFRVREGTFEIGRVAQAEEIFLSSSVREVMPVTALDGRAIGDGLPGEAARRLQDELRALATGAAGSATVELQ
jgi:branched-subunit amino acid aminotransferase/4-amino-4-deoxychorismate lyase